MGRKREMEMDQATLQALVGIVGSAVVVVATTSGLMVVFKVVKGRLPYSPYGQPVAQGDEGASPAVSVDPESGQTTVGGPGDPRTV